MFKSYRIKLPERYQPLQPLKEEEEDEYQDAEFLKGRPRSSTSDSDSTLLCENTDRSSHSGRRRIERWMWLIHVVLLTTSFSMFAASYFRPISALEVVRKFSAYSSAAEAVEYQKVKFNGTMGANSPYVGYGEEVDAAWRGLSFDIGDQVITPEELKKLDMPTSHLKASNPKTGVDGYRVGIQVFHQLHCINLLRQATFKEYYTAYGNGNFAEGEDKLRMHLDHCLEMLRMNTQCHADVGMFTFYMLDGDPLPWPELNSWHTCRNFEKIRTWALDNSIGNMERPELFEQHDDR